MRKGIGCRDKDGNNYFREQDMELKTWIICILKLFWKRSPFFAVRLSCLPLVSSCLILYVSVRPSVSLLSSLLLFNINRTSFRLSNFSFRDRQYTVFRSLFPSFFSHGYSVSCPLCSVFLLPSLLSALSLSFLLPVSLNQSFVYFCLSICFISFHQYFCFFPFHQCSQIYSSHLPLFVLYDLLSVVFHMSLSNLTHAMPESL